MITRHLTCDDSISPVNNEVSPVMTQYLTCYNEVSHLFPTWMLWAFSSSSRSFCCLSDSLTFCSSGSASLNRPNFMFSLNARSDSVSHTTVQYHPLFHTATHSLPYASSHEPHKGWKHGTLSTISLDQFRTGLKSNLFIMLPQRTIEQWTNLRNYCLQNTFWETKDPKQPSITCNYCQRLKTTLHYLKLLIKTQNNPPLLVTTVKDSKQPSITWNYW